MRVAVPSDEGFDGNAVPFEKAKSFAIAEVGPDGIKEIKVLKPEENIGDELKKEGVELVLAPEVSKEITLRLARMGITVLTGFSGKVKDVMMTALKSTVRDSLKAGLTMAKIGKKMIDRRF
ncbi:NifB/NifX family molybdenum-iron cluster-binding protein [Thermococcus sp.]|uniref:NifB/NifX family molybdenum-iron cluster-binding protein n=1 Tax=Thermococcus sp. TaxID=35749 RepID=UPI0025E67351|nr:NifB/NifX family molybdenum-iron cluster-binding protein [Thermococcus sp.]